MLSPARVEVKSGRVGHVASGVIRHDSNVVAYLLLYRPALKRVKRIANSYIRRPRNTAIGAVRIE